MSKTVGYWLFCIHEENQASCAETPRFTVSSLGCCWNSTVHCEQFGVLLKLHGSLWAVWGAAVERGCYKPRLKGFLLPRLVRWPIHTVAYCLANVVPSSGLAVLVCSNFCWLLNIICCLTWVFSLTECSATGGKSGIGLFEKNERYIMKIKGNILL